MRSDNVQAPGALRRENFHHDSCLDPHLLCNEHLAHPATAKLTLQAIGLTEGFLELGPQFSAQTNTSQGE